MWTILNVRSLNKDIRHANPLEAVIKCPDDPRLDHLLQLANTFALMGRKAKSKRSKQLTMDTAKSLHHTLNGMVELCRHLLATGHDFVMLGEFNNDPIERLFGQIRQGSGGTYFVSALSTLEKLDIMKAKLLLKLNADDVLKLDTDAGHSCAKCGYKMDEEICEVFDHLPEFEEKISRDNKMSLVHIAGYVTRHDSEPTEEDLLNTTTFYHQKYGDYTDTLDRGWLNIPTDNACQWTFFAYLMFNAVKNHVCRKSLSAIFMEVSKSFGFDMTTVHARVLSNILFNNHCKLMNPRSTKETKLKVLKLSEDN